MNEDFPDAKLHDVDTLPHTYNVEDMDYLFPIINAAEPEYNLDDWLPENVYYGYRGADSEESAKFDGKHDEHAGRSAASAVGRVGESRTRTTAATTASTLRTTTSSTVSSSPGVPASAAVGELRTCSTSSRPPGIPAGQAMGESGIPAGPVRVPAQ